MKFPQLVTSFMLCSQKVSRSPDWSRCYPAGTAHNFTKSHTSWTDCALQRLNSTSWTPTTQELFLKMGRKLICKSISLRKLWTNNFYRDCSWQSCVLNMTLHHDYSFWGKFVRQNMTNTSSNVSAVMFYE